MRIFPQTTSARSPSSGFTLVELLVVIGLIAFIATIALPNISNFFKVSLNSVTLKLASTIKQTYNSTVVTGRVHRIVYDLEGNQFWVESGPADALLESEKSKELAEERRRFLDPDKPPPRPDFELETSVTKNKVELPRGVKFRDVLTEQSTEPILEGVTYTHFFPHGVTEQTVIRLEDTQDHKVSLVISPITGKSRVINEHIEIKDFFAKK